MPELFVPALRRIARRRMQLDPAAPFLPEERTVLASLDGTVREALQAHAPGAVIADLDESCRPPRYRDWETWLTARRAEAEQPYLTLLTRFWVAGRAQAQLRRYALGGCAIIIEQTGDGLQMVAGWFVPDPLAAHNTWIGTADRTALFYLPLAYGHEVGESGEPMLAARNLAPIVQPKSLAPPKPRRRRTPRVEEVAVSVPPVEMPTLSPRRLELGRAVWSLVEGGPRRIVWGDVSPHIEIGRGPFVNGMRELVASGLVLRSGEHPGYLYDQGCPWVQPVGMDGKTPLGPPVNLNEAHPG